MKNANEKRNFSSLSDVLLYDLRVEGVVANLVDIRETARLIVAKRRNPVLYVVLEGSTALKIAGKENVEVISAKDCGIVMYGDAHCLGDGNCDEPYSPTGWEDEIIPDSIPRRTVGEGPLKATVLICFLDLSYMAESAFANRIAPSLFVSQSRDNAETPQMPALTFDPDQIVKYITGVGGAAFVTAFAAMQFVKLAQEISYLLWRGRAQNTRSSKSRCIAAIVREIRAHPHFPWTLVELARRANLSRSAFAEAFMQCVGEAPMTFVLRERMDRAARLLRTEGLSIQEIARRVGYSIEGSFARAFKRHWGVSPREYSDDQCCARNARNPVSATTQSGREASQSH